MSPSSFNLWVQNRDEYYLHYLCETPPPRTEQTLAMAIGSGFDARIKSYLAQAVFGNKEPRFELDAIFTEQVAEQHRDRVWKISEYIFNCYKNRGALTDLLLELNEAASEPKFEFTVEGHVSHEAEFDGVPILGKPDVYFRSKNGLLVILDWKINSYFRGSSPKAGYVNIIDLWDHAICPASRYSGQPHKDATLTTVDGITINTNHMLEDVDRGWAVQLAMYAWVLNPRGQESFIAGIDQLTTVSTYGEPSENDTPLVRVSRYRNRISPAFQTMLYNGLKTAWQSIQSGHIFDDRSREDSDAHMAELDKFHEVFRDDTPNEKWYSDMMRKGRG